MSKFVTVTLSELGKTITGKTPSSESPKDFGNEIPFITPPDFIYQKYISRPERFLSPEGCRKLSGKLLSPSSIMVNCIGSIGKIAMTKVSSITNQQINAIIVSDVYSPEYVFYTLRNSYKIFRNAAGGSTVLPLLNKTDFDFLQVRIHKNKKDQEIIAAVLSTLDAKIECNNRINAELEAMAKTLYDYWFVQFEFPDHNGQPYKSSGGKMVDNTTLKREIPAGWRDGTLDNLGQISGGSTPSTKNPQNFTTNGTPWITPKDLSDNQGNKFITRGAQDVSDEGIKDACLKIYPTGTVLLSSRAPVGYMAIAQGELTTNQGFKSFVPTSGYSTPFIYYTVKNTLKAITQYASGSTFMEISGAVLKTVKICLPDSQNVKLYTHAVESIFKRQDLLEQENQHLAQLRDWLLPMLMNGQVTVL